MALRPSKWILRSPIVLLPFVAATFLSSGKVTNDLLRRAQDALTSADAGWAQLAVDGRDASIAGDSPSQDSIDAAVKAVAGTYGIRRVQSSARVVEPPPKVEMLAPTVNPVSAEASGLVVTGTFHEGVAATLKASLGDKSWVLGESKELISDGGGNWTLTPGIDLAPGTYDLVAEATDADGKVKTDSGTTDITILPPPPPPVVLTPPTVDSVETNSATPTVKGTWPSTIAKTLSVAVNGVSYVLGQAEALKSEADNWTLTLPTALKDGSYDVTAEVGDGAGQTMGATAPGRLVVDTTAPAAPSVGPVTVAGGKIEAGGTWSEGDAVSLVARLAGKAWQFGKDAALASDGKGNWTFKPDVTLDPGTYDLEIEIADKLGNVARDSTRDEVVIAPPPPPPPEMKAPTIEVSGSTAARPVLKGTWSEVAAKSLSVALAGGKYVLGSDEALTSDGIGNWTLAVPAPLKDGIYDVVVESTDAAGKTLADTTSNELTVDAVGPASPTVKLYAGEASPDHVSGTWDAQSAKSLGVAIPAAGITAVTGDAGLSSSGNDWTLALPSALAPGSYDVEVKATDSKGRVASDQTRFEILVKEPPPPPLPPPLKTPGVARYSGEASPLSIFGTWDEGSAASLKVSIPQANLAAELGKGPDLLSDGKGNWSYVLPSPLAPGLYDVTVETSDAAGRVAGQTVQGAIEVKPPPPPPPALAAPTVTAYSGEASPVAIAGTWDEGNARTLRVAIMETGLKLTLGSDPALTSDGKGNWWLALAEALAPGKYSVMVETTGGGGRAAVRLFPGVIEVKAPPPPPPPPPLKPATVAAYAGEGVPSAILGTWDEPQAKSLTVAIPQAGLSAELGKSPDLQSDGSGNWTFKLPATLAPGVYDVTVDTSDGGARETHERFTAALTIKSPPPPPPALKPATVAAYSGEGVPSAILGTWDEAQAKSLTVAIPQAGLSAEMGKSPDLQSDGSGNWTFKLPAMLAPGIYDVTVETSDGAGRETHDSFTGALEIKSPPPPPLPPLGQPTVTAYSGEASPGMIGGGWDEANARTLRVAVVETGLKAALGTDPALTSDGKGNWSLVLAAPLPPGKYSVMVETTDGGTRAAVRMFPGVIEVKAPAPPPEPPYDCAGELAKIVDGTPIRFRFDRTELEPPYDEKVDRAAALLNDPRCAGVKVAIEGHADYFGGRLYNEALSIRRAQAVLAILASKGVAPSRMKVVGKGELTPLDPERSIGARRSNRRVVITIVE